MRIPIPRSLYVDSESADHPRVGEVSSLLPGVPLRIVEGEEHPGGGWLLTQNRGAFLRPCPGQKGHVCCGYWTMEWVLGCPFRCEYCALQAYLPSGDLTLYVNLDDGLEEIRALREKVKGPIRLGTGEFGDSLALEPFFPTVVEVAEATARLEGITLELKTKGNWVEPLEDLPEKDHIVVAFSMNPPEGAVRYEHGAATIPERLTAVEKVLSWGYTVAFHFDPILDLPGGADLYGTVIEELGKRVPSDRLAWISMGTFRYPAGTEEAILHAHPATDLFSREFVPGKDGKRRYPRPVRERLYRGVLEHLLRFFPKEALYLCMESPAVWNRVFGEVASSPRLTERLDARR